jgi:hypothetical protein
LGGLLGWESPEVTAALGADGSLAEQPTHLRLQLRSQSLAVHTISCQHAGYGASEPLWRRLASSKRTEPTKRPSAKKSKLPERKKQKCRPEALFAWLVQKRGLSRIGRLQHGPTCNPNRLRGNRTVTFSGHFVARSTKNLLSSS